MLRCRSRATLGPPLLTAGDQGRPRGVTALRASPGSSILDDDRRTLSGRRHDPSSTSCWLRARGGLLARRIDKLDRCLVVDAGQPESDFTPSHVDDLDLDGPMNVRCPALRVRVSMVGLSTRSEARCSPRLTGRSARSSRGPKVLDRCPIIIFIGYRSRPADDRNRSRRPVLEGGVSGPRR